MSYQKPRCNHPISIYQRPGTNTVVYFYCQKPHYHEGEHLWKIRVGRPQIDGNDDIIIIKESDIKKLKKL